MDTELVAWAAEQGIGRAPGSFGELLQGALNDAMEHFLVTLPIKCYSLAKFVPVEGWLDVEVVPSSKTKSLALARRFMQLFGIKSGGQLFITSDLPEGKGLASSTADRSRLPRYCSSFDSNREKSANESAAEPAKPARMWSL